MDFRKGHALPNMAWYAVADVAGERYEDAPFSGVPTNGTYALLAMVGSTVPYASSRVCVRTQSSEDITKKKERVM